MIACLSEAESYIFAVACIINTIAYFAVCIDDNKTWSKAILMFNTTFAVVVIADTLLPSSATQTTEELVYAIVFVLIVFFVLRALQATAFGVVMWTGGLTVVLSGLAPYTSSMSDWFYFVWNMSPNPGFQIVLLLTLFVTLSLILWLIWCMEEFVFSVLKCIVLSLLFSAALQFLISVAFSPGTSMCCDFSTLTSPPGQTCPIFLGDTYIGIALGLIIGRITVCCRYIYYKRQTASLSKAVIKSAKQQSTASLPPSSPASTLELDYGATTPLINPFQN